MLNSIVAQPRLLPRLPLLLTLVLTSIFAGGCGLFGGRNPLDPRKSRYHI